MRRSTAICSETKPLGKAAVANGSTWVVATSTSDAALRDSAEVTVSQAVASVDVTPSSHTFEALHETVEFRARAFDAKGSAVPDRVFTWSDDLTGRISFASTSDSTADATAEMAGAAWLRASTGGVKDSSALSIAQVPAAIEVAPAAAAVSVGDTVHLAGTVLDAGGAAIDAAPVSWSSLDPARATVSASGVVTAVSPGSARIVGTPEGDPEIADTAQAGRRLWRGSAGAWPAFSISASTGLRWWRAAISE